MVKHIVIWKQDDRFTNEEKISNGAKIKESLEALKDIIPGIVSIKVITEFLPTGSDGDDLLLDSVFESEEALNEYQNHPEHVKAASFVRSVVKSRKCVDYYE
jgi:heme-degrading monooxygenase HmoA